MPCVLQCMNLLTGEQPAAATERVPSETLTPPRQLRPDITPLTEQVILTGNENEGRGEISNG